MAVESIVTHSITNHDAEDGDLTGWTTSVGSPRAHTASPFEGTYVFDGGASAATSEMYQDIDLVSDGLTTGDIDAGKCLFHVHYQRSGFDGLDLVSCRVKFLETDQSTEIGLFVENKPRSDTSGNWNLDEIDTFLPATARYVRLTFRFDRNNGTANNGKVDVIEATTTTHSAAPTELTITNPGGETGDTTGWTDDLGGLAIADTDPLTGTYFFFGGTSVSTRGSQNIDLTTYLTDAELDSGSFALLLKHGQDSFNGSDGGAMGFEFFDVTPTTISTSDDPDWAVPVGGGSWRFRTRLAAIPVNTRSVDLRMMMERTAGTNNNGHIDDIEAFIVSIGSFQEFTKQSIVFNENDFSPIPEFATSSLSLSVKGFIVNQDTGFGKVSIDLQGHTADLTNTFGKTSRFNFHF